MVNKARCLKTAKLVAVKEILTEKLSHSQRTHLKREIDILKFCDHPNLIKLLEVFELESKTYLVLELSEGGDLFDFLKRNQSDISEEVIKRILVQIANGIKYLHGFGIIHRDLKLENVVMSDLTDEATPKIVDFGFSMTIGPNQLLKEQLGTVGYVAPEILQQKSYGKSCDVWSFGCMAYALLCGALPFDYQTKERTMMETVKCNLDFELPGWKNRGLDPRNFCAFIIVKDPKKRPKI
mmetsp:Transcript_6440/g.10935  ORF Transcript_6440/g.10935 Transcript_6440/m.10935 type:complete len:238 (+) Transcript_6440:135-848(+)